MQTIRNKIRNREFQFAVPIFERRGMLHLLGCPLRFFHPLAASFVTAAKVRQSQAGIELPRHLPVARYVHSTSRPYPLSPFLA